MNASSAAGGALPECLDCGACCHSQNPRLVELLGADAVRVPPALVERDPDGGTHMRMRPHAGRQCWVCAALQPDNACSIYAQRPFLCREFERGSPECLRAIADMTAPPGQRVH